MSFNPFSALVNETEAFKEKKRVNEAIEDIFGFTINDNNQRLPLILVEIISPHYDYIELDDLDRILFERLLLVDPRSQVVPPQEEWCCSYIYEKNVFLYLFECYLRLDFCKIEAVKIYSKKLICRNFELSILEPSFLCNADTIEQQLHALIKSIQYTFNEFTSFIKLSLTSDKAKPTFAAHLGQLCRLTYEEVVTKTLVDLPPYVEFLLEFVLCEEEYLTEFLNNLTPKNLFESGNGHEFANNLLGALLATSILPRKNGESFIFYENFSEQSSEASLLDASLRRHLNQMTHYVTKFVLQILLSKTNRTRMLQWIGQCLYLNRSKGNLWNMHGMDLNLLALTNVTDGFMMNLSNVLVRLCHPFYEITESDKFCKIDPTYAAVPESEYESKSVHLPNLCFETCLLPGGDNRPTANSFKFVTECFFFTHRAYYLGFRVVIDKFTQARQELRQATQAYADAVGQWQREQELVDTLTSQMENASRKYFSMRAMLLESNHLHMWFNFHTMTAEWLTQVTLNVECNDPTSYAPLVHRPLVFPLPDDIPFTLKCIPEFIIENVIDFIIFLKHYSPSIFEVIKAEDFYPFLSMIIIYMGSSSRVQNPHLRAHLAEALEALLPGNNEMVDPVDDMFTDDSYSRNYMFHAYPHYKEILKSVLKVFVDIETTGQSVQFEQKFGYRHTMYIILFYLWRLPEHRGQFKVLAKEALENITANVPPLFLKFVNSLINDTVYLLDEAITNMAKIKELREERNNREWENMSSHERAQRTGYIQHLTSITRFNNKMGQETLCCLQYLTSDKSDIVALFMHDFLIERITSMLNYFLLKLVGSDRDSFLVKDSSSLGFNHRSLMYSLCSIYEHLGKQTKFQIAIAKDARSYRPSLFINTLENLDMLGISTLRPAIENLQGHVEYYARKSLEDEESLSDAPEEFLDPIMNTVMIDPVMLPTSRKVVDRSTIARHLLSDQTDPFNRSLLSMEEVIPLPDLTEKIKKWVDLHNKKTEE